MMTALTIIHVVISLALVVVVLMQHGKQQGLSGAIAGGAETFFGKNKGRTVDAMLKKFTAVIAILFIISSIAFTTVAVNQFKATEEATAAQQTESTQAPADAQAISQDANGNLVDANGNVIGKIDDKGNLVDANGNVQMTAEQMQQMQAQQGAPAENAPAASAAPAASEAPKN